MIQPPANLQEKVNELARRYPDLQGAKFERYKPRIQRLINYYKAEAEIAPEHEGFLFSGFVHALIYSISVLHMHRKLTRELAELARGDDHAKVTND